ncbi:hypothetical protein TcarDRAFT_1270 [Thermosinus carboxydivorans Nor1]|uniref:Uncharacterized protein n=2 Tax=Thermosinus TaxID=261684 RepID=A1HR29_9FIRM|nr:hypothetical protein TcarDRAFT_1270 [Thermosinus carboxydivorans Nor1]
MSYLLYDKLKDVDFRKAVPKVVVFLAEIEKNGGIEAEIIKDEIFMIFLNEFIDNPNIITAKNLIQEYPALIDIFAECKVPRNEILPINQNPTNIVNQDQIASGPPGFSRGVVDLYQEKPPMSLLRIFFISFILCLIISLPIAYYYYDSDIVRYQKAAKNEIKLYPPTQQEIDRWEARQRQIQIETKRKEILFLQMGVNPPEDLEFDAMLKHLENYPTGHNPPFHQIQKLLDNAYQKRQNLIFYSIMGSLLISITIVLVCFLDRRVVSTKKRDNR